MSDGQDKLDLGSEKQEGRVEEYKFEPIKGYPMLNWRGKRPFTSTQFYPAQLKEVHGPEVDGWRNKIFWGDNLQVMSHLLKDFRGKIDLVYIDPPFDSKANYGRNIKVRGKKASGDQSSFEEKQYGDIWNNDEYLQFMYERLCLCRELMSKDATIALHCDAKRNHHLKCMLDEIFGSKYFKNEIIWYYENKLGTGGETFDSLHDTILIYTKSKSWTHNKIKSPVKKKKKQPVTKKIDGERVWLKDDQGNLLYDDSSEERSVGDVWNIPIINPVANERLGYPTQKPEQLLEQIISNSSNPGDIVFDFFMGSGTSLVVADHLGRRYIGADINLGAIQLTTSRLIKGISEGGIGFETWTVNNYDLFRNPVEAKGLILEALEVQALADGAAFDGEKDGRMVKIMPVNRIATKADLGEIVSGFDQKAFQRRQDEKPNQPVEKILLVCMGHEPDLKAELELQAKPFKIDVEVVDILRDKSQLEFKRDAEAKLAIRDGELVIENFYPMNLLQKLSLQQEQVGEWRELVDSLMVDWNYDGAVLQPAVVDVPGKDEFVAGRYQVPADAGTIRVKITDLLSESWEGEIDG